MYFGVVEIGELFLLELQAQVLDFEELLLVDSFKTLLNKGIPRFDFGARRSNSRDPTGFVGN